MNIKTEINVKYKNMQEAFEHNRFSRTAIGNYNISLDSIRLMKWLAFDKDITKIYFF